MPAGHPGLTVSQRLDMQLWVSRTVRPGGEHVICATKWHLSGTEAGVLRVGAEGTWGGEGVSTHFLSACSCQEARGEAAHPAPSCPSTWEVKPEPAHAQKEALGPTSPKDSLGGQRRGGRAKATRRQDQGRARPQSGGRPDGTGWQPTQQDA